MKTARPGFTLIEMVISLTILVFVVAGILTLFGLGLNISGGASRMTTTAVLAERLIEEVRQGGFAAYGGPVPGWYRDLRPPLNLDPSPPYFDPPAVAVNHPDTAAADYPGAYCGIWDDDFDGSNDYPDYFWLVYLETHPDALDYRVEPDPEARLSDLIKATVYIFHTDAREQSALLGAGYRQEEFVTYLARYR